MTLTRRTLLTRTAAGAGIYVAGNLSGLFAKGPTAIPPPAPGAGGSVICSRTRPVCSTCRGGFSYEIVSHVGDPLTGGGVLPDRFDGTGDVRRAPFDDARERNHEQGVGGAFPAVATAELTYDPGRIGGTSTFTSIARQQPGRRVRQPGRHLQQLRRRGPRHGAHG